MHKSIFRLLIAATLLFILGACTKTTTEEYGSISGFVTDANTGEPLRAVDITLTPGGLSAVSGSDGRFEFLDLDADRYTIQASKAGYQTNTKVVNVRSGRVASGDIMLTPSYADMDLSTDRIDFGLNGDVQTFQIINNASTGSFSWSVTKMSTADWLTVSPTSGNTTAGTRSTITLTADRTQVTSTMSVNLRIVNTTTGSERMLPVSISFNSGSLTVSPTTVDFGTSTTQRTLTLHNTGGSAVGYEIVYNCAWLSVSPTSGSISANGTATVNLTVNRQALNGDASTVLQVRNVNDGSAIAVTVMASTSGGSGGSIVVPGGLMAYYTFDDGTANDLTENGVHASVMNGGQIQSGNGGHYLFLNAMQHQYLNIPYNLFNGRSTWSVSFWIKDFGPGNIFSAQNSTSSNDYSDAPKLWATQEGRFTMELNGSTISSGYSTDFSYNYFSAQADDNWHHVAVVASGVGGTASVKLYVDGSLRDQISLSSSLHTINNCTKIAFGGDKDDGYSYASNMKLDNIRIYNRAISATEVQTISNDEQ